MPVRLALRRAMFGAVALVVVSYVLPVAAVARTGLDANAWTEGGWVDIGRVVGGEALAVAIAVAGLLAFGSSPTISPAQPRCSSKRSGC